MIEPESIFVYGAGGHGGSVAEVVRRQGRYRVAAVLDDRQRSGEPVGSSYVGGRDALTSLVGQGIERGVIAIGANRDRELIADLAADAGLGFVVAVDPTAVIASGVELGAGTVVMPQVVVNVGTTVGRHAILNTSSSVDHDCRVGDYSHLSPGVRLSGECVIEDRVHLGIGSCVIQQARVGEGAQIGAGGAVVDDVAAGVVAVGVPARPIGVKGM